MANKRARHKQIRRYRRQRRTFWRSPTGQRIQRRLSEARRQ